MLTSLKGRGGLSKIELISKALNLLHGVEEFVMTKSRWSVGIKENEGNKWVDQADILSVEEG